MKYTTSTGGAGMKAWHASQARVEILCIAGGTSAEQLREALQWAEANPDWTLVGWATTFDPETEELSANITFEDWDIDQGAPDLQAPGVGR